jgi:hypothetical protein
MAAREKAIISTSIFDCRYAAEKLTAVLQALDEAHEQTTELHDRLGAEGFYALTSELLPHAIEMGQELVKDLRRLEGEEDRRSQVEGTA